MEIFISAGEASGDLHGSHLVRAIWSIAPQTRLSCLGGPHMQAAGVPLIVDNRNLSVVGATEIAGHIRAIYGAWRKIRSHLLVSRPALVVLIDFPDFNLFLGKFAKKIGAKVFYYICPQLWAWRGGRINKIRRLVDRMAVILPFEKAFYASHGMEVDYVGHPLVDIMADLPDKTQCDSLYHLFNGPLVGLLPGSRRSEISLMFDILMDAGRIISRSFPAARFLIPLAPSLKVRDMESMAARWSLPVQVVHNDTYSAIRACDLILTASGTVTLEAAILETPMIVLYKVSRLSWQIGNLLIRAKFAALPNLIAGKAIVPEFVREEPTGPRVAECAIKLLMNPALLDEQRLELRNIRNQLGAPGISERVARLALDTARGVL
ncbi:MAG TPA: lipid-A-disaccharide synthase [Deltaproteobacteria bacterium]|nr:lipid-A-disaccharide synthase [Deltaproteobacteria bacterium]